MSIHTTAWNSPERLLNDRSTSSLTLIHACTREVVFGRRREALLAFHHSNYTAWPPTGRPAQALLRSIFILLDLSSAFDAIDHTLSLLPFWFIHLFSSTAPPWPLRLALAHIQGSVYMRWLTWHYPCFSLSLCLCQCTKGYEELPLVDSNGGHFLWWYFVGSHSTQSKYIGFWLALLQIRAQELMN